MLKWIVRAIIVIGLAGMLAGGLYFVVERTGFSAGHAMDRPAPAGNDGTAGEGSLANGQSFEGRQGSAGNFQPGRDGSRGMDRHGSGGARLLASLAKILLTALLVVLGQQGFEWLLRRRAARSKAVASPPADLPAAQKEAETLADKALPDDEPAQNPGEPART